MLVIVVASWALVGGAAEFFAGFQTGESAGTRALFLLSGLVSFVFGVLLFARPASARSPWPCCSACTP